MTRDEVRDTLMMLEVLTGLVARLAAQHIELKGIVRPSPPSTRSS